jgi:hypothetical protein
MLGMRADTLCNLSRQSRRLSRVLDPSPISSNAAVVSRQQPDLALWETEFRQGLLAHC